MPRAPPAVGSPRSARRPRGAGPSAPRRPGLVLVPTDLVALDLPGILSRPRRAMDWHQRAYRRGTRPTRLPCPPAADVDPNGWSPVYALARAVSTLRVARRRGDGGHVLDGLL